jgi:predicted lipoprotein with Yx(FWY)xxD motif
MRRIGMLLGALLVGVVLAVGLVAGLLATRSSDASGATKSRAVVKVVRNAALGKRILVTRRGLTLYSLSAERHGRFICTATACLSLWKPLVVAAGVKPTGVRGLATVRRPDGRRQVAYRGAPLYRFVQDSRAGRVKGNGFRDVGVWRPVVTRGAASAAPAGGARNGYGY